MSRSQASSARVSAHRRLSLVGVTARGVSAPPRHFFWGNENGPDVMPRPFSIVVGDPGAF